MTVPEEESLDDRTDRPRGSRPGWGERPVGEAGGPRASSHPLLPRLSVLSNSHRSNRAAVTCSVKFLTALSTLGNISLGFPSEIFEPLHFTLQGMSSQFWGYGSGSGQATVGTWAVSL